MKRWILPILAFLFPAAVLAQVKINEFMVHPGSGNEWVEFFNASDSADYIKSYFIDDDLNFASDSGNSPKKALTLLNTDSVTFPYINLLSDIFNNGVSGTVALFDNIGTLLDQFDYPSDPGTDVSWGRNPDNTGDFATFSAGLTTKGAANVVATPTPTPTPTPEVTPTPTPTPTPEVSPSPSPSPSGSPSPFPHFTFSCRTDFLTFPFFGHILRIPRIMCMAKFV